MLLYLSIKKVSIKTKKVNAHISSSKEVNTAIVSTENKIKKPYITVRLYIWLVGMAGFEPTTSWSQTRHSNRTELHPDYIYYTAVREGFEPSVQFPIRQFSKLVV